MNRFINRERELAFLEEKFGGKRQLIIMYVVGGGWGRLS